MSRDGRDGGGIASAPGRPPRISGPATAALGAAVLFVGSFVVQGALRPGYDPARDFVSELSFGPFGWVQRVTFVLTGALLAVFALAPGSGRRRDHARRGLPSVLLLLAVALGASGLFDTDPSTMFTPRTPHGWVHAVLGAVVFVCMPTSALIASTRRGGERDRAWRRWSLAVGIVLIGLTLLLKVSELPQSGLYAVKGVVQRADLVIWFAWLVGYAWTIRRGSGRASPVLPAAR